MTRFAGKCWKPFKSHKEKDKGLYLWSRTQRLRQTVGREVKGKDEIVIPNTQDPSSVLEFISKQPKGLFVLCDFGPYLAPYGQEDSQLVRRLRELAWEIKARHTTVLFVERSFPEFPSLEKEVKTIELPLPDEREVTIMLDVQMQKLEGNGVRGLAAEQTRQSRFSHIVFVDLPTTEDRREIFSVHLRKRKRDPKDFDLDELADATDGFSGAEIEAAVKAGLLHAFMDNEREVTTADVRLRARQIQPTSQVKREQIESLRNWAREHMAIDAGGSAIRPIIENTSAERALEM